MEVKGTAFLARRAFVEREFGAPAFDAILRTQAAIDAIFRAPVLATTRIPIDAFLRLNDAVVRELFAGDERSYFKLGEQSADWALHEGPYKKLLADRSVADFIASAPTLYRNYYTVGDATAERRGDVIVMRVVGIPVRHVFLEYVMCGYFRRGLTLVSGRPVTMFCVRGFSRGDGDVEYHYTLG